MSNYQVYHKPEVQQINLKDNRYYTADHINFYPSSTTILDVYPKGFAFANWLKDLGHNSEQVVARAAESGSRVHNLIEKYLMGWEVEWDGIPIQEWTMFLGFVDFWETYKPNLIATEKSLCSPQLGYGGTLDLVCEINDEIWLIDAKTSNAIHSSYELQLASYRMLWNGLYPDMHIQRHGIFWMKAQTRGADKTGKKIQGKGWILSEYERDWGESFDLFLACQKIWKNENPNYKPLNLIYPDRAKRKDLITQNEAEDRLFEDTGQAEAL